MKSYPKPTISGAISKKSYFNVFYFNYVFILKRDKEIYFESSFISLYYPSSFEIMYCTQLNTLARIAWLKCKPPGDSAPSNGSMDQEP